jgi:hypothetical protein
MMLLALSTFILKHSQVLMTLKIFFLLNSLVIVGLTEILPLPVLLMELYGQLIKEISVVLFLYFGNVDVL